MFAYYYNRLIKKLRGTAILNSNINSTARIGSGSQIVNSSFGKYSYCGYDCKVVNCNVGSFTSIADKVVIGGAQHPINWASSSPAFYIGRDRLKNKFSYLSPPTELFTSIGNDVWIGESALIRSGVTIGNGAVIGMGSVVVKDVSDYSIVAGNPAKVIRMRFNNDIIQDLLRIKWWDLDDDKIRLCAQYIEDTERFIEAINQ